MRNCDMTFDVVGSSALQPTYSNSRLRVIDGRRLSSDRDCAAARNKFVSHPISEAIRWNRETDPSTCVAAAIDERQQLAGELGFLLVTAIVVIGWILLS